MPEPAIHLLLVDEHQDDSDTVLRMLRNQEEQPFTITTAADLPAALEALAEDVFDLLLVDFSLTGSAGLQGFFYLRGQTRAPIVLLTSQVDRQLAMQALSKGAQDFILKDKISSHQLVRALQFAIIRHERLQEILGDQEDTTIIEPNADDDYAQELQTHLGKVQFERIIGEGASSTVYRVRLDNPGYPPTLALKLLKPHSSVDVDARMRQLAEECQLAKQVDHPNVMQIFDCGTAEHAGSTIPFLLMEYVDGHALRTLTDETGETDLASTSDLLLQVACGLAAIHAAGIRHGDIKPGNLQVTSDRVVKITDFGIAALLAPSDDDSQDPIGSPAYMAPEVLTRDHPGPQADIFSFGVVAYECLLGQRPFRSRVVERLTRQIRFERPVEPRKLLRDFPDPLQRILAQCLRKAPDDRYADCVQLAEDLRAFHRGSPPRHATSATGVLSWGSKDWS